MIYGDSPFSFKKEDQVFVKEKKTEKIKKFRLDSLKNICYYEQCAII